MVEIKDMRLLAALARHRHFARAAEASGISQPAFSARIRKIEERLGLPVVRRGNKFQGFTREGEVLLKWFGQTRSSRGRGASGNSGMPTAEEEPYSKAPMSTSAWASPSPSKIRRFPS
jgi:hypothetical protein